MTDDAKLLAEIRARHEACASWISAGFVANGEVLVMHADRATLLRMLDEEAAQLREAHALIGTIREMAGCKVRNLSDIDYEAHSREIGDAIEAREARLREAASDLIEYSHAGASDGYPDWTEKFDALRAALAPEVKS